MIVKCMKIHKTRPRIIVDSPCIRSLKTTMVFVIEGKVALVTGGASGIGLDFVKELLRNGCKGVTLADISQEMGEKVLKDLDKEFGPNKVLFVETDVSNMQQFEEAFKKTIETFKNIDILINNAGILNDIIWEKEIAVNFNGVVHGVLLGMDKYLPKFRQDSEAVIINVSSVNITTANGWNPVYSATKHAVLGLTRSWGVPQFYNETKVRVIAICPGGTSTPLTANMSGKNFGGKYQDLWLAARGTSPRQEPQFVAQELIKIIKYASSGTAWIVEGGETAYQYIVPDRTTMKGNTIC